MTTIIEALSQGKQNLPRIDIEILLCFVLKKDKSFLFSHPEYMLSQQETLFFNEVFSKRLQDTPIAYITNTKEFWSLPFTVNQHTLIPRSETEGLVERVLFHIKDLQSPRILELGTGCGAIAIAIAHERPDCAIIAIDISKDALKVAEYNAKKLNITNVKLFHSNWFSNIHSRLFNIIVTNPPYIAAHDKHLQQEDLRFEPYSALCAGTTGLEAILEIAKDAKHYLLTSGWICIEHGYLQKDQVQSILNQQNYDKIHTLTDLQGHDRITEAQQLRI